MILSRMMASLGFLLMFRREPSKGSLPHNIVNRMTPMAHMSNGGPDVMLCYVMLYYVMLSYIISCYMMFSFIFEEHEVQH
jgi:hypothetical protein